MQEIDVIRLDSQGQMTDQTVLLRPWPVVTLLRDRATAGQLPFRTASCCVVSVNGPLVPSHSLSRVLHGSLR